MKKNAILIAGVGNPYRCDDGIGVVVVQQLQLQQLQLQQTSSEQKSWQKQEQKPSSFTLNHTLLHNLLTVDLLDAGTDGLALLDIMPQYKLVIIVDAVNMRATPGTVKIFTPQDAKINITHDALSTHGFGLAEMLQLAEQLGITATVSIKIIGIEPQEVTFGTNLSSAVQRTIPQIIEKIMEHLSCP